MKAILTGVALVGVLGIGAYINAHGGTTTQIHGCVDSKTGNVRIVSATAACRAHEVPLDWSITGPIGPQGAQGVDGPQGPIGPQGSPGPPGDSRLTAIATEGTGVSKFASVPGLGRVEVACTEEEAATLTVTPSGPVRVARKGFFAGAPDLYGFGHHSGPIVVTAFQSVIATPKVDTMMLMMEGNSWTVAYVLAGTDNGLDNQVWTPCMASAVVTALD